MDGNFIYNAIVKAESVELARTHAERYLGEYALVGTHGVKVNDYEVRLLVQCPVEELQRWFSKDNLLNPPYPPGSLLMFSQWTKRTAESIWQSNQERSTE